MYIPGELTDFLVYNVDCILPCPRYKELFFFLFYNSSPNALKQS